METAVLERSAPKLGAWQDLPEAARAVIVLAMVMLVTRAWIFGDPVVNIDEQFYLMVGDKLLHGILPYVDIWDRKPIGLFVIYAGAALTAHPVLAYQLLAASSVLATSFVLYTMARRLVPFAPALAGAAAYPPWLLVFGGVGGQSPVFYNLPMALAAAWTLRLVARPAARHFTFQGCAIMVLCGVAMQIKYTALFEGVFFGLTLLWLAWERRHPLTVVGAEGLVWIACALLPTAAAATAYFAIGQGDAFMQANFLSVFGDTNPFLEALGRLSGLLVGTTPLLACAWLAWRRRAVLVGEGQGDGGQRRRTFHWLLAWVAASYAGFFAYGVWNDHYTLPVLMPLCTVAAFAFATVVRPRLLVGVVAGLGLVGGTARAGVDVWVNGTAGEVARLQALVAPGLGKGCLYVNEELSILYQLNPRACLPTRYVFPQHLALDCYKNALGIDQLGELRRVLASRPTVVVLSLDPDTDTRPETRAMLLDALHRDYRQVGTAPVGWARFAVWSLKPDLRQR